ncbi:glycoside hydrolase superfamily [Scheffersomyces xylosifermentans]|uniref:glycoside hydrolase superfamily n=1 Tax=Scheffersomyces xylosifermentans TaxID=1304137 RepID=UPI00315CA260
MKVTNFIVLSFFAGSLVSAAPPQDIRKRAVVTILETVNAPAAPAAAAPTAVPFLQELFAPTTPVVAAPATTPPTTLVYSRTTSTPLAAAPVAAPGAAPVAAPGAAPVAAPAAAPVATPAAAPAASPVASTASKYISGLGKAIGGFFSNLFGNTSSDTTAAPAAAPVAAPVPTTTAPAVVAPVTTAAASDSTGDFTGKSLFAFLFGDDIDSDESSVANVPSAASTPIAASAPIASVPNAVGGSVPSDTATPVQGANANQAGLPLSVVGTFSVSLPTGTGAVNSDSISAAEGALGITYSPYTKTDACKSAQEVASDIAKLSSFSIIRLYSTDCSGIENVLAAIHSNQKLFLGIWGIDQSSVVNGLQDIQTAVESSSRGWSAVHTIAIGNERVNDGQATVADIQSAVGTAKSWLKSNASGYTGPVVSVDTLVAVISNPGLCQISDYLAVNSHPYWDGGVQPGNSGPWLLDQIANLQNVCGGNKQVLITETGWPTEGQANGVCIPSVPNQATALESIVSSLGSKALVFTMYNDYWKSPGSNGVEQYWGIFGDPSV